MPTSILVVDDNPINLKLTSDLLGFEGYNVYKAIDAENAIEVIKHTKLDLILMDIGLPGMDGLTLTKKLKTDESTKHIIIVALTAFAMKGDEEKAFQAGCDGYISKPINTRNLPKQIEAILQNSLNY